MTTYRVSFTIRLDDAALAEHDGDRIPPPNGLEDWIASDVFAAYDLDIVQDPDDLDMDRLDG